MKWFQIKEKSAGKNRLLLCWWIYNILGVYAVKFIAVFVALITFIRNKDIRIYSQTYFNVLYEYTHNKLLKPTILNSFLNVLSYALSLVDKMEVFAERFNTDNIIFENDNDAEILFKDIQQKGVFFICNHIGNIEILRGLLNSVKYPVKPNISIFMQQSQCEIFNKFINKITKSSNLLHVYPIENIDISTAIELESNLNNTGIALMAGDRTSSNNPKNVLTKLFNKNIELPIGVFKFAKMLKSEIYFISCLKINGKYRIYLQKNPINLTTEDLQKTFIKFMEKMIIKAPYQFYNFYDIFITNEENIGE